MALMMLGETGTGPTTLMTDARRVAMQCWQDPETQDREFDAELAEAFAKRLERLMDLAEGNRRLYVHYRDQVEQWAVMFKNAVVPLQEPKITDKSSIGYELETKVGDNGEITQTLVSCDGLMKDVVNWVFQTREATARRALIALGWTPPEK